MKCLIRNIYGKYNNHRFKFSVSSLCDYVGISRSYFYKIVDNESIPTLNIAFKIAKYLNDFNYTKSYTYPEFRRTVNVYDLWDLSDIIDTDDNYDLNDDECPE